MFVLQSNWFRPMQVQYKSSPSRTLLSQVWVMIGLVGSWIWTLAYICRTWNIFLLCWRPNIFLLCWRPINHDGCQILIMYNRVPRTRAKGPSYSRIKKVHLPQMNSMIQTSHCNHQTLTRSTKILWPSKKPLILSMQVSWQSWRSNMEQNRLVVEANPGCTYSGIMNMPMRSLCPSTSQSPLCTQT